MQAIVWVISYSVVLIPQSPQSFANYNMLSDPLYLGCLEHSDVSLSYSVLRPTQLSNIVLSPFPS